MTSGVGTVRGSDSLGQSAGKLDVFSNDLRPASSFYTNARALFEVVGEALPVMYERRFLHTRDGEWDMDATRRALWQFTMAGGAAGIYGVLWGPGPGLPESGAVGEPRALLGAALPVRPAAVRESCRWVRDA